MGWWWVLPAADLLLSRCRLIPARGGSLQTEGLGLERAAGWAVRSFYSLFSSSCRPPRPQAISTNHTPSSGQALPATSLNVRQLDGYSPGKKRVKFLTMKLDIVAGRKREF